MSAPRTAELSLFVGPDESPLSEGGRWSRTSPLRDPLERASNKAQDSVHGNPNYSHWSVERFDSSHGVVESWGCLYGGQLGAALETWRVCLWTTVGVGLTGYLFYIGGSSVKRAVIRRYNGSVDSFTNIADVPFVGYAEKLAIVIDGDTVEGWESYSDVWYLRTSAVDTTYRGKFYAGLAIEDPTGGGLAFNCFGAGIPQRSQFFRWTRGFGER